MKMSTLVGLKQFLQRSRDKKRRKNWRASMEERMRGLIGVGKESFSLTILKSRSILKSYFIKNINILKLISQTGKLRHKEIILPNLSQQIYFQIKCKFLYSQKITDLSPELQHVQNAAVCMYEQIHIYVYINHPHPNATQTIETCGHIYHTVHSSNCYRVFPNG